MADLVDCQHEIGYDEVAARIERAVLVDVDQALVVPERPVHRGIGVELCPNIFAITGKREVACGGSSVVALVGGANEKRRDIVQRDEMLDVRRFTSRPVCFLLALRRGRIGAAFHDGGDDFPEFAPNVSEPFQSSLVFHGIVKQRRNRFVLGATCIDDDRGGAEEMTKIRDGANGLDCKGLRRGLTFLMTMNGRCVNECFVETFCKFYHDAIVSRRDVSRLAHRSSLIRDLDDKRVTHASLIMEMS